MKLQRSIMLVADHLKLHRSLCWRGTHHWERLRKKREKKRGIKGKVHNLAETQPCSGARESGKPRRTGNRNPHHSSKKAATKTDKILATCIIRAKKTCGNGEENTARLRWEKGQGIRTTATCWLSAWRAKPRHTHAHAYRFRNEFWQLCCREGKRNSIRIKRKLLTGVQMDLPYQQTIHVCHFQTTFSNVLTF